MNQTTRAFPYKDNFGNESFDMFLEGIIDLFLEEIVWKWDGGCISRAV